MFIYASGALFGLFLIGCDERCDDNVTLTLEFTVFDGFLGSFLPSTLIRLINLGSHFPLRPFPGRLATVPKIFYSLISLAEVTCPWNMAKHVHLTKSKGTEFCFKTTECKINNLFSTMCKIIYPVSLKIWFDLSKKKNLLSKVRLIKFDSVFPYFKNLTRCSCLITSLADFCT